MENAPPNDYLTRQFSITEKYQRFDQKNDIFNRSMWDDKVNPKHFYLSYDITNYKPKKSEGFDHWDYALRNASWHLADYFADNPAKPERNEGFTDFFSIQVEGAKQQIAQNDVKETTRKVKRAAILLGAGDVGICKVDDRWLYATRYNRKTEQSAPLGLPADMRYAIIVVTPMDYELTKAVPSATGSGITGVAYSSGLSCINAIAQFITNLGYEATASLNDSALSIPMAIQAGLGEYGRHGLLITKKFGPRVRIGKVFTNMPLQPDQPIEFGVKEFCNICQKCASGCPVKAIPKGEPNPNHPIFPAYPASPSGRSTPRNASNSG